MTKKGKQKDGKMGNFSVYNLLYLFNNSFSQKNVKIKKLENMNCKMDI